MSRERVLTNERSSKFEIPREYATVVSGKKKLVILHNRINVYTHTHTLRLFITFNYVQNAIAIRVDDRARFIHWKYSGIIKKKKNNNNNKTRIITTS